MYLHYLETLEQNSQAIGKNIEKCGFFLKKSDKIILNLSQLSAN